MNQIEVDAINNHVTDTEGFKATHAESVGWGWLVDGPVVHWWVFNWVGELGEAQGSCDRGWSVGDEVFEGTSGDVVVEKN